MGYVNLRFVAAVRVCYGMGGQARFGGVSRVMLWQLGIVMARYGEARHVKVSCGLGRLGLAVEVCNVKVRTALARSGLLRLGSYVKPR
jgi:hypothetical protein